MLNCKKTKTINKKNSYMSNAMKIISHKSFKFLITCLKNENCKKNYVTNIKTTQQTSFNNVLSKTFMKHLNATSARFFFK